MRFLMTEDHKKNSALLKDSSAVLDAAYGQEVITLNEFRLLLGLECVDGGDITVKGRSLQDAIHNKNNNKR